jgi:hypothetical protein
MTLEELAKHLNREPETIKKIIKAKGWDKGEDLKYFVDLWVRYMLDFGDSVKFAEEIALNNLISVEIKKNDIYKMMTKNKIELQRLQALLQSEYDKAIDIRDVAAIVKLEKQVGFNKSADGTYIKAYESMLSQHDKYTKQLKAAREQRDNLTEDASKTWSAYLRLLESAKERERIGQDMELKRLAAQKKKKKLAELHEYADGEVDRPLLSHETVDENDD